MSKARFGKDRSVANELIGEEAILLSRWAFDASFLLYEGEILEEGGMQLVVYRR